MENYLSDSQQALMRQQGIITATEVIRQVGDLFVAEDVVAGTRRVIERFTHVLPESTGRRILKG
jgi:hypothetical protein